MMALFNSKPFFLDSKSNPLNSSVLDTRFSLNTNCDHNSYTGRTQHIHVAVLANNTVVLNNGTVYQNVATHVGQVSKRHVSAYGIEE